MATFSLNSVTVNFVKYLLFFFSIIILSPYTCIAEINIFKIKNKIHVLDLHGKRFFLNKETKIKSGDYLTTREKPASIIFEDNTQICFHSNSSLKILKIKDKINIEFIKGKILFSVSKKSQKYYNLYFLSYNVDNVKDNIILTKKNNIEVINFKKDLTIFNKNNIKKINLPPFSVVELSNSGKVFNKNKLFEIKKFSKKLLEHCTIKLPKINKSEDKRFKLQYGCISQNGNLICGNKYK